VDDDDADSKGRDNEVAKELGLLKVKVYRTTKVRKLARSTDRLDCVGKSISEKALKGRAISNCVSYVKPLLKIIIYQHVLTE
jgi:hypothetical protein